MPSPGDVVRMRFGKWGSRPHWEMDGRYLGEDAYGRWVGSPAGMPMARPGMQAWTETEIAVLIPHHGDFVASFYGPTAPVQVYVDITDRPVWEGDTVRAVDLDLDVVRRLDNTVFVDDEDEFIEHQALFGYPPEIVAAAQASCDAVLAAVRAGGEPWGRVGFAWAARGADVALAPFPDWAR